MTIQQKKLPIAALERIDDRCAEFERAWQSGEPRSIEETIAAEMAEDERDLLLAELLVLEIDYRRRNGESPEVDEYVDRFPENANLIREALGVDVAKSKNFEPPSLEKIGELFPTLEIISLLGVGGMGAVYKARQKGLDRLVALKILPEEFGHDVKFALRFTREARTLARLNHPNIVSVHEFGSVDEVYYFLMEFVDGSTLRDVVAARELAPEHALKIVPHLCDALQYAHDHGVVHRDIKPENILLAKDGSIKIADFGLSRIMGSDNQAMALTQTHQVLGAPRYMAPEQFEGSRRVDHRADIYSLGVVFYEMLTGELPMGRFEAPSQKVQVDVRLDEVVLRTLEKEPRRRYQAASEIKSDLHSIASTPNSAYAATETGATRDHYRQKDALPASSASSMSLAQQETAARLLLSRRELMDRVRSSLRPLRRGQTVQIMVGIALVIVGAQCWARNTHIPHRIIKGVLLHVYGIVMIGTAAHVLTRIGRMDWSKPVAEIR
ncbi:MAG: serine/threonine-protein kinase, partial [Planctomycetota bacterium]